MQFFECVCSFVLFTGSLAVLNVEGSNNEIKMYPLSADLCNALPMLCKQNSNPMQGYLRAILSMPKSTMLCSCKYILIPMFREY